MKYIRKASEVLVIFLLLTLIITAVGLLLAISVDTIIKIINSNSGILLIPRTEFMPI